MGVKLHTVVGKVYTGGRGTATVDIKFPVTFIEEPTMTFGASLGENSPYDAQSPPSQSVVVISWDRVEKREGANIGYYYKGATLSITVGGVAGQITWIHWAALAKAFRNPTNNSIETVDGTV
jgi:hypothetical protein